MMACECLLIARFFKVRSFNLNIDVPKRSLYTTTIMSMALYANKEEYACILEWGQNSSDEWYHPVSRSQFTMGLSSIKPGDTIEFILDGVSTGVQVVEVGNIYDYPLLKHINGEFSLTGMRADRVIRVKRI